jgi:protein phosphatase
MLGQIEAFVDTDPGLIRDHNEDFIVYREPTNPEDEAQNGWLYIVADGVGGADAGEVASQYASESTKEHFLTNNDEPDWGQRLLNAMQAANTALRQMVVDRNDSARMATTMVAAVIYDQRAYVANVGDSRCYFWRNGQISQVTKDQSLVAKLVEEGAITEAEAINHPRKNVILYSLGSEREPKIELFERDLEPGDILILCSDGLTRHVADEEIEKTLLQLEPQAATRALIHLANGRGGEDNISVAVIRYGASQDTARVILQPRPTKQQGYNQTLLWFYTIFLSLIQTMLILIVWLLLRV